VLTVPGTVRPSSEQETSALVELADARGLVLGSAPATLLGEAQQTLWNLVREDAIGKIRVVYAEANWGHIESWQPMPATIYAVGAAADVEGGAVEVRSSFPQPPPLEWAL
jgi:predicted dehydrogenase